MALLEARNLTKRYAGRDGVKTTVVDNVSFAIDEGETLGLVGESGSGKSTVARMVLRLVEPDAGDVFFDGHNVLAARGGDMRKLRRNMQIVFQDPMASLDPRMRVEQIIGEPLAIHENANRAKQRQRSAELLRQVGLDESALPRFPHEFSGGQRQRISIARALVLRPRLLVLDEPVSALDVSVAAQVINLLRDLQRDMQLTCLFISHSMPLVRYFCSRIAVMQRGRIVESGDAVSICTGPHEAYTQALIAATPEMPAARRYH